MTVFEQVSQTCLLSGIVSILTSDYALHLVFYYARALLFVGKWMIRDRNSGMDVGGVTDE